MERKYGSSFRVIEIFYKKNNSAYIVFFGASCGVLRDFFLASWASWFIAFKLSQMNLKLWLSAAAS